MLRETVPQDGEKSHNRKKKAYPLRKWPKAESSALLPYTRDENMPRGGRRCSHAELKALQGATQWPGTSAFLPPALPIQASHQCFLSFLRHPSTQEVV